MGTSSSRPNSPGNRPRVVVSRPRTAIDDMPTVVALLGELDAAALHNLSDTYDDAITHDDSDVVVDLAAVDFIGAAWIGTFVRSRASLRAQDRDFTVRAPSRAASRLLELCGLSYLVEATDILPTN